MTAMYADAEGIRSKGGPRPYGYAEHTVRVAQADYQKQGCGFWAPMLKETTALIGRCGLIDQSVSDEPVMEVAYNFAKEYWGQGLATEAAQAIKEWDFAHLSVDRLVSFIPPDHLASHCGPKEWHDFGAGNYRGRR